MKIAIYTIALNEARNVPTFMDSHRDADLVVIGDTGSTDNTKDLIKQSGGHVVNLRVLPWRFDVPRNALMTLLPEDIDLCLAIDLDERLQPGWRDLIENAWKVGEHNRLKFRYVHNYTAGGAEGAVGLKDFAHARPHYIWKHVVHEKLYYIGPGEEKVCQLPELTVEHHQLKKDSREMYMPLLLQECEHGAPTNQHVFWLAREFVYQQDWTKAVDWFERFLQRTDIWYVEKAHAYKFLGKCYHELKREQAARSAYLQAVTIAPKEREVWLELAYFHAAINEIDLAYYACCQGLRITTRPEHYLTTNYAWGYRLYDLAARCAWNLGYEDQAREHARIAVTMAPDEQHVVETAKGLGLDTEYEVEAG